MGRRPVIHYMHTVPAPEEHAPGAGCDFTNVTALPDRGVMLPIRFARCHTREQLVAMMQLLLGELAEDCRYDDLATLAWELSARLDRRG